MFFKQMYEAFIEGIKEINLYTLLGIALFLIVGVIVLIILKKKNLAKDTRTLTLGSVCVALAYVLSFMKLYSLPAGGSITVVSMLPIIAFGYMAGPAWGTVAGLVYSLLQMTQGTYFVSVLQFAFDYLLPFTLLGTCAGLFKTKNELVNIFAGATIAVIVRYACHFIAGWVFWGEYAAEYGYASPVTYSLVYNSFVLIDGIPCLILLAIPQIRKLFARKKV